MTLTDTPTKHEPRPGERRRPVDRWTLWVPIGLASALGVVLLVTVALVRAEIGEAAQLASQAQIDSFARDVHATLRRARGAVSKEELTTVLEAHSDDGLRYLAIRRHGAELGVGESLGQDWQIGQTAMVGERLRSVLHVGPPPRRHSRRPGAERRPRGKRGHGGAVLALEFEPLVANRLRSYADAVLWGAVAAVLALLAFAALFSRSLRQRERLRVAQEGQRRLAALGEMSAVMAHEVRNPLTSLKGNAQLLAELVADDDPNRERVDLLVEEAVRLQTLTNDLLEFARSGDLRSESVMLQDLVAEAVADVGEGCAEIVIGTDTPARWPLDRPRIKQALVNIVQNAVEASPASTVPVVSLSGTGGLEISIRDHGAGIPEGDLPRLFEPFFTAKTRGVGLGLAIAKRVVDLHGGTLTATNHPDGGALFTMTLPREA